MAQVLASAPGSEALDRQPSEKTDAQSPVHLSATRADSSEPRTPDNEPPASVSRQRADSPASGQHDAPSKAGAGAAGDALLDRRSASELPPEASRQARHVLLLFKASCFLTFTGSAKAAGKRAYEKWSDAEEDTFFAALKANAGCLPNVVCTAAAKRIGTKDYIQVQRAAEV